MIVFYFLLLIPFATSLSFNLDTINTLQQNVDITTFGDAYISPDGIQVTSDKLRNSQNNAGKATYINLLQLWDKSSNELTDFSTHFTFVIDSAGNPKFADGLTFFLAPEGSGCEQGGAMGLPIDVKTLKPSSPFVAVEFDTFQNQDWDPVDILSATHVGISINSLESTVTKVWNANIADGLMNECGIDYDSGSKNLSVVYTTNFEDGTSITSSIYLVVDLREILPEMVSFGFSASTGTDFETHNIKSWDFSSNLDNSPRTENPIAPIGPEPVSPIGPDPITPIGPEPITPIGPEPITTGENKNKPLALGVGLAIGSCIVVGGFVLLGVVLWGRRRRNEEDGILVDQSMENEFEMGSGAKKFSYDELSHATSNFSEEQKLGEGGFGGVYKGFMKESSSYIAVKRISKGSEQGLKEYASEVRIISRLRHRNLVQLIGWCRESGDLLLVYELLGNGSLDLHLFEGKSMLTWAMRFKIAEGLASALLYLHEGWEQCVLHRDIKSSNVMLDSNFNAKLGDFGLARFVDHGKGSQTTVLAGTMGYMAPECMITGKASKETDVYSLGIVMLEIACGRKPFQLEVEESQVKLVEWVWSLYGTGKLLEAADPKLGTEFDRQEMGRLMITGLWCAHPDYNFRPSIKQAIQVFNFDTPLPELPPKMPVPTYFPPPMNAAASSLLYSDTSLSMGSQNQSSSYSTDYSNTVSSSSAGPSPSASLLQSRKD